MLPSININGNLPLYKQTVDHIKYLIVTGMYAAGSRLSIRGIMKDYGVGKKTVERAFDMLKDEGIITSSPRSISVVSADAWNILNAQSPDWYKFSNMGMQKPNRRIVNAINARYADKNGILSVYKYGFDENDFHANDFIKKTIKSIDTEKFFEQMYVNDKQGHYFVREAIARHVRQYGINTTAENIITFDNYTQAYNTLIYSFLRHGSNFYMINHDLMGMMEILSTVGANTHRLPYDCEGPRVKELEKLNMSKHNMLYINPVNHYPTGITVSQRRRDEILNTVQKIHLPVIENDMLRDLWIDKPPPPPLKSEDKYEQIIYIGSLASTYDHSMRLAWVIAPLVVVSRICDVHFQVYGFVNRFSELLVNEVLRSGAYGHTMNSVRKTASARLPKIKTMLDRYMKGIAEFDPDNILSHIWLTFRPEVNIEQLFFDSKVNFLPGEIFHSSNSLVMSSVSEPIETIENNIITLARLAQQY